MNKSFVRWCYSKKIVWLLSFILLKNYNYFSTTAIIVKLTIYFKVLYLKEVDLGFKKIANTER